ncbi:MAG: isoprenyl transferase [Rickettsiales bacterium]
MNINENSKVPQHIAIVMDGNRRWAEKNNKSVSSGHKFGAENAKKIAKAAHELGVKYLTLYAFSSENWNRSAKEVEQLMFLLNYYLKNDKGEINKNNMRLNVIGNIDKLPKSLVKTIKDLSDKSSDNTGLILTIAISYGSQDEIIHATKEIAKQIKTGNLKIDNIDKKLFAKNLFTCDIPDPDLFIRPSGEFRVSNFLLWQIAYSELYFSEKLWPDFGKEDLKIAIEEFKQRKRRYGK